MKDYFNNVLVKFLLMICLSILVNSCVSNSIVVGLYGKCPDGYFACNQIELKKDQTFEYYQFMDVGGASVIKGTWKKSSENLVILNSYDQPVNSKTTLIGRHNPNFKEKEIQIQINDKSEPFSFAFVSLNNGEYYGNADQDGIINFEIKERLRSITFQFLTYKETINIENLDFNEFVINLKDVPESSRRNYFINEKVIIKSRKLTIDSLYTLKKTKAKNKRRD
ncbi:hypothetical protein DDD_0427 [Nonlabens dokdonensis DSW-6]|uniref:Uncharacterized protein n=2 Tax=Nonlabens dokdonensis TaxID=328515 RepID=L7W613_NONDD|nr:hypothetical protein DDD_0427 [Nonlabens dokdonensis DSW-6]